MLRFRKLHLQNWKNFKEARVDLQDRMFLVGPNASGKSNLLDALRFLRDLASLGGGFGDAVRRRGGVPFAALPPAVLPMSRSALSSKRNRGNRGFTSSPSAKTASGVPMFAPSAYFGVAKR